jgi:hypothetical protein
MIQGLLFVPEEIVNKSEDKTGLLRRLWVHESMRVYSDRLINQADKVLFLEKCLNPARFFTENAQDIVFCNFVEFNPVINLYLEVNSTQDIRHQLNKILEQYNAGKLPS